MEQFITYLGATVSALGAIVAWYFNFEMKRYELAQAMSNKILDKRFECYPRVWELCQKCLTKLATTSINKTESDAFLADLLALYQNDGLYYSDSVRTMIAKIISDGTIFDPIQPYGKQLLAQWINGGGPHKGILPLIKNDLGAYVVSAGAHTTA